MNLKKMLIYFTTIITVMLCIGLQTTSYAAQVPAGQERWMGIVDLMTHNEPYMGYSINTPDESGGSKIWSIVKYKSSDKNSGFENGNFYCVKAGLGFFGNGTVDFNPRSYNVYYSMKTERENIKNHKRIDTQELNQTLKELVEGQISATDKEGNPIQKYNAILATLDRIYLPAKPTDDADKKALALQDKKELICRIIQYASDNGYRRYIGDMAKAFDYSKLGGVSASDFVDYYLTEQSCKEYDLTKYALTDNDIVAVQQAVLWYFTNNEDALYDNTGTNKTRWLKYNLEKDGAYNDLANYELTKDENGYDSGTGLSRNSQAEVLYNYLIEQAKDYAKDYENSTANSGVPAKVDTTTLNGELSGDNYIIGPMHMTELNSMPYSIDFEVKNNGTKVSNYTLLDKDKKAVANGKSVKDLVGENFYISIPKNQVSSITVDIAVNYKNTNMTLWVSNKNNEEQPLVEIEKEKQTQPVQLKFSPENPSEFDLALRKYITKVNGKELTGTNVRVPNIDENALLSGTTAKYKHKKDPVSIATGDTVTYKMTIYNEGKKAGRATKVVDQLPTGLKFSKVVSGNFDLGSYDETTNTLNLVRKTSNQTNLPAFVTGNLTSGKGTETIEIECTVTAKPDTKTDKVLTNVAWISEEIDEDGTVITTQVGKDRDSEPANKPSVNKDNMSNYAGKDNKTDLADSNYYYKGQQDDDDFEKLILLSEAFDLKLIKYITAVNGQNVPNRVESIDVSKLNTSDANHQTTADYKLNKEPVSVAKGDIVTYTFSIYNEGMIDGYAEEITEDVPEGLQFLWSEKEGEELKADTTLTEEEKEAIEFNQKYLWGKFVYDESKENIIQISTDYLAKDKETTAGGNLIKAFGHNDGTKTEKDLDHKEIAVKFKVVSENVAGTVIRNEAAITKDSGDDRDSDTDKWVKYEDDEDYDNIILQSFDLALRKFIIAVSDDTKIENNEYLKNQDGSYTRAPIVDTSKLNTKDESGKLITTAIYNHTKEPIIVKPKDIVVYMLRVYNEGDVDGYAAEVKDHLPPYLTYVDDEFNKQYGWQVSEDGRTVTTKYLENSLITKAQTNQDGKIVLSYKEVPIMCQVKENAKSGENITNIADITKYLDKNKNPAVDRDSQENNVKLPEDKNLPNYKGNEKGSYIPGQQDDDDFEKVNIKIFDLALRKWVTQAIVIENGKQTVTQTGHDAWDDPEAVVKVELHRKKLNQVTVKFRYSIRVYNQGEIEGYAKEITDYVPEGLKFVAEDNPGWKDEGNNVISTRLLENTLLQPGEYADVEVLLTWINDPNNMGVMNNTAEISEDYNKYGVPDIDSTPDNKKSGEDDIDDAPVMLSISTGQIRIYFTLGFVVLITIASGVILIKKFVL